MANKKVKIIKDTSLISVDVASKSEVVANTSHQTTDTFLNAKIDQETKRAKNVEQDLQAQIRNLKEGGYSVTDVVSTYADLVNYNKSLLVEKDVIIVLADESMGGGVTTMYRWNGHNFISLGSSNYTVAQIDTLFEDVNNRLEYLEQKPSLRDVVLTYNDLVNYDTTGLVVGDLIAVLEDSTHSHATTYYRFNENGGFDYFGGLGPIYYNRDEIDAKFDEVNAILEDHEERITENRTDIDSRMDYSDTERVLHGGE